MSEKKNVPELRFEGFEEPWESKRLIDVIEKLTGGASIAPDDYVEEGYRTIPKGAINASGVADLSGCKYVADIFLQKNISSTTSDGELVTSLRDLVPSAPNMGRIVRICTNSGNNETFLMPQGVYSIAVKHGIDEDFLIAYSNTPEFRRIISSEKNGSTQVHIRNGEYLNIGIFLSHYDEQKRIGIVVKNLDTLLTLQQRKCERLKNIKKAMLEKMFPREGRDVPEIRFEGFSGAWERSNLGEMVQFSKGTGYSKADLRESGTPIILYGRLYTRYETVIQDVDTFADEKPASVYSRGGEVIVPASGETAEDISIASVVEQSGILLGGDLNIITPPSNLDSAFLAISISNGKPHRDMAKMAQGKSVVHLHNTDLAKIELKYPCFDEQAQISTYFSHLDHLITLHQQKYEKLKQLKQSLLEKMFV